MAYPRDAYDRSRIDWTRLRLANAVQTGDPNAIEDPLDPFEDIADGDGNLYFEGSLLGGTATIDPGSAKWWTFLAGDVFGRTFTAQDLVQLVYQVRERLAPGLATDTYVAVGWCTEADLNSATVDAIGVAIVYAAGTRNARVVHLINGAVTVNNGAAAATTRRVYGSTARRHDDFRVVSHYGTGLTDAGVNSVSSPSNAYDVAMGTGNVHLFLAFGRTAATPGTVIVGASAFYVPAGSPPVSGMLPV